MGVTSFDGSQSGKTGRGVERKVMAWVLTSALSVVGATGCGVQDMPAEEEGLELSTQEQAIEAENGLSLNGLSLNGLSLNGLSLNGLSLNGLSTTDFSSWFNGDLSNNNKLMRYMVRCAVPHGQSRAFYNSATGTTYSWPGVLGLAPNWASGAPATVAEQQVISACLAAHANNFGINVSISVLGRDSKGTDISYSDEELKIYSRRESCFFGNIFTSEGMFGGNDRTSLAEDESTSRPCGLKGYGAVSNSVCAQVQRIGQCEQYCTLDPSNTFYTQCTYKGVQYRPLTTRIRQQDIHRCGDGVCQRSESCGWGITADSCLLDCGTCG